MHIHLKCTELIILRCSNHIKCRNPVPICINRFLFQHMNGIFYVFVMYGSVYVRDVSDFKQNNTPMHTNVISFNDPRRIA